MQMPDLEVFKEIPGYKAILKAVLKTQIQSLVEQLSKQTGEESVIVTASLEDGSLTHLGSDFGKVFLDSHDQIKSQFLGFCLKRNQMLHKSQVPQSNVIRKKGPFGAGKRPRLAPYYMTNPSKKVPRKSLPRLQHTQQRLESNQNYTESLEPVYNHCEDLKPGTSQMNAVVKREPGLDGEDEPSAENQIYMENMTNAFPSSNYLSEKKRNDAKVKIEVEDSESCHGMEVNTTVTIANQSEPEQLQQVLTTSTVSSGSRDGLYTKPLFPTMPEEEEEMLEKPECAICNKKFKNFRNLKFHMMTHSGVRPYSCTFCPKRFGQKNVLDQHLLTHTGQKPFACSFCGRCFSQRGSRYRHELLHKRDMTLK